jgi:hypothetical protein
VELTSYSLNFTAVFPPNATAEEELLVFHFTNQVRPLT